MNKLKTLFLFIFAVICYNVNASENLPAVQSSSAPSVVSNTKAYTVDNLPITSTFGANKFVCNPDGILTAATVDSINSMMQLLEEDTKYQVLVVAVNKIEPANAKEFATNLGNKLGVGDSALNSGVVVLLAKDIREIYIATGIGTQKHLSNSRCQSLIDNYFVPSLKNNDFDGGMLKGASAVYDALKTRETKSVSTGSSGSGIMGLLSTFGIMGLIAWLIAKKSGKKCPKCGKKMNFKKEYFKDENGKDMMRFLYTCPGCDYKEEEVEERYKNFGKGKFEKDSGAGAKF